jgi:hypothetical protein
MLLVQARIRRRAGQFDRASEFHPRTEKRTPKKFANGLITRARFSIPQKCIHFSDTSSFLFRTRLNRLFRCDRNSPKDSIITCSGSTQFLFKSRGRLCESLKEWAFGKPSSSAIQIRRPDSKISSSWFKFQEGRRCESGASLPDPGGSRAEGGTKMVSLRRTRVLGAKLPTSSRPHGSDRRLGFFNLNVKLTKFERH